jgi:hypothetical protein
MQVIGDISRLNAKRYPEKKALIMDNESLNYSQLDQQANQEEGIAMKSSSEQTERSWVAVQAGLFEYPVEEGRLPALLANQCTKCGRSYFPKRAF